MFSFYFVYFLFSYSGSLKCELINYSFVLSVIYLKSWAYVQFTIMTCYVYCVHAHHDAHNITNANCNPWTASISDRATKIIVTLLFNDGIQKFKNSVKADDILFGK